LDILFPFIENSNIHDNDFAELQDNCLLIDEDDVNRKFKEIAKKKKKLIIRQYMKE
jgi:hypothetical protein